ncbi:putative F420-dependent oxidoreductase [Mycobacterium sp. BK086]|uniref:LLM class F420-dependent oxidoreductase n=1 Tax=Mycobacterium sp. BK086 TaxID=2512165 RepID=UPI00106008AE|nr:LLM class F420-dependent oxidoreductase [Mycobacterium sp. BK086]TDO17196.1 putative F420-dependent oxidoreductase [Mycobacterium sp. BK086]
MRIGLSTPMVMQLPGAAGEWEANADVTDLARIARAADELGFDHLTCAEHIAIPVENHERGLTYWDPLSTLGFLAAHTSRISLTTSVVVLGYHHPLEIAKRFGTLDRLSGGRLVLGVGVGSLKEEFELLGATFDGRGDHADDAIRALRASLSTTRPAYQGTHYRYDGWAVQPCAVQQRVPIWVGGRTRRSLRRAVGLADGWIPFGLSAAEITAMLAEFDAPPSFEVVLSPGRPVDPLADRDRTAKRLSALRDAGATAVTCSVTADSPDHYCDQLAALRELANEL